MILLPAVDIRGGRAVRLRQGRFDQETVYEDDPLTVPVQSVRQLDVVELETIHRDPLTELHVHSIKTVVN